LSETVSYFGREYPPVENIDEYIESRKEPYTLEYFSLPKNLRGVKTYQKYGENIDNFVRDEMVRLNLNNKIETYKSIIDDILSSLDIHQETNAMVKLEKINKWIKNVLLPQRKIDLNKLNILER